MMAKFGALLEEPRGKLISKNRLPEEDDENVDEEVEKIDDEDLNDQGSNQATVFTPIGKLHAKTAEAIYLM